MISHVIWDLGDTINTPPNGGQDLQPLHLCMEIQLRPHVKNTLQRLADLGYKQAVLSNTATSDSDAARCMLERLEIAHYFEFIYATQSELTPNKPQKPSPIVFEIVLNALKIEPNQAVMIGNSWDNDVIGANQSGIHAIWIQNDTVAVRQDTKLPLLSPPWIIPVWDVDSVPDAVQILRKACITKDANQEVNCE